MLSCGARLENGLDVNGHISVGRAEAADDTESQTLFTTFQLNIPLFARADCDNRRVNGEFPDWWSLLRNP